MYIYIYISLYVYIYLCIYVRLIDFTHVKEACHTFECNMQAIHMRNVTHFNKAYHTHE